MTFFHKEEHHLASRQSLLRWSFQLHLKLGFDAFVASTNIALTRPFLAPLLFFPTPSGLNLSFIFIRKESVQLNLHLIQFS